jgi:LPPG:FO 2-phospho-L-lactate transferase
LITVIAGGTGSVKLVRGLAKIAVGGSDMAVIANVGDNIWLHGLYVCPDVDTMVYGLAGVLDEKRGWGVTGDTFSFLDQLRQSGERPWFSLGDRDLAMHVVRTAMMTKEGKTLSEVTGFFTKRYGIDTKIIPATDDEVTTMILSTGGKEMHLQEFWVKNRGRPEVSAVRYAGIDRARPCPAAIDAIRNSEMIIIAPGNPVSSIGPTAAIAGLRAELVKARDRVVAVSPIIGDRPVSGPAAKYMKAIGLKSSPVGVAEFYSDFAGALVISKSDANVSGDIRRLDMDVHETNITMAGRQDEVRLARYLLKVGTR